MAEEDEEKMAFHTPHGVYCYTKMPFGLKNAGATYQRLVDKAFEKQAGRNLEVYVDDLVIKSHTKAELLRDIEETFRTLRKINMKLNPKKCTFGAVKGMFLGYMIGPEGIKPCPEKIEAVLQLPSLRTVKEVQSLNGKLAGLNRPKEELIMYLSASQGAVGAVLMTERDLIQTLVYFVSRALQGPELNYTPMEKLVLALVFAAKRLRRYFQAHPIAVITDQPIKQVMSRPEVAGRLQKWSIMLGEHNITYRPRTSVKGQILADFLAEKPAEALADRSEKETPQEPWTLFTDGSSCIDGSGAGLILTSPEGAEFTYALRFQFIASNNEAEYEALLARLRTYIAKEENMIKYLEKVKSLVSGFASFLIRQVLRSHYKKADALSKIASTSFAHLSKQVLVEVLQEKSIQEREVAAVVEEEGPTWITPITEYLKDGVLPDDKNEANKLRIKARQSELHARWTAIRGRQSHAVRILLANHAQGCMGYDTQVQRLPTGPFPEGPGKVKFLIGLMDYFTKWIEAKAVATISGGQVKKFVWDNIVCRFGLPGEIVSDNGKQFSDNPFKDWCEKLNIIRRFASVKDPQSNGLVERANRSLGEGIKARLGEGNKNWIEEIPHVLWAHRIMIKSSNGDTPFSLTYGTEAVIPAEIGMPSYRTALMDIVRNDEEIRLNLDLVEERCEQEAIREAKANNEASHAMDGRKLGPKWEGSYEVIKVLGGGAYKLRSMDGAVLPRTWNIANLKKCYL
ncbi:reverse transcriptase domain-containing protein [Tanacetum coccineum]